MNVLIVAKCLWNASPCISFWLLIYLSMASHFCQLFESIFNETQEPLSIKVWFNGGYFRSCSILHSLGCIGCPLLDTVASQNINNSQKIDFWLWTLYTNTRLN